MNQLNQDIILNICEFLDIKTICILESTNTYFYRSIYYHYWEKLFKKNLHKNLIQEKNISFKNIIIRNYTQYFCCICYTYDVTCYDNVCLCCSDCLLDTIYDI